jgi:hypothetical protein
MWELQTTFVEGHMSTSKDESFDLLENIMSKAWFISKNTRIYEMLLLEKNN